MPQACGRLPPNGELIAPEEGSRVYQTLSWLLRCIDGYRGGCVPPLPLPQRNLDGSTVTADELAEKQWRPSRLPSTCQKSGPCRERVDAETREHRGLVDMIKDMKRREGAAST
jgi:hypothetical protein